MYVYQKNISGSIQHLQMSNIYTNIHKQLLNWSIGFLSTQMLSTTRHYFFLNRRFCNVIMFLNTVSCRLQLLTIVTVRQLIKLNYNFIYMAVFSRYAKVVLAVTKIKNRCKYICALYTLNSCQCITFSFKDFLAHQG